MNELRRILQARGWSEWDTLRTDQKKGIEPVAIQKPVEKGESIISLPDINDFRPQNDSLMHSIAARRSHRKFNGGPLTIEELSYLLWATQGIQRVVGNKEANLRTVPSGGGRHPFETYLVILNVRGLENGIFRYIPLQHGLLKLNSDKKPNAETMRKAARHQPYFRDAAVVFVWTCIPYRTYWRYERLSTKIIAQDSGHLCQNLYLACTSINAGTCAIGAYFQEKMDTLIGVDGVDEFVIYLAPVGKIDPNTDPDIVKVFKMKYST